MRALQRKIEALEKSVGDPASSKTGIAPNPDDTELAVARTQARIDAAEARMASLAQQIKTLRSQRAQYEGKILQTPQVERGMTSLLRDYENAKTKFEEVRSKQMSAQISESLEEGKKAERFALLEPPVMPDVPIEPNRKKIAAMGFFLALVSSGGVVMLLETVQQRVHGVNALAALLKLQPLVAIPYIHTQAELTRRKPPRRLWLIVSAALLLLLVAAGIATHFLYQPLDMVWIKFLAGFE